MISKAVSEFATRQTKSVVFIVLVLCAAGVAAALSMPSSVFPQTNFPRVVINVDNGVMPCQEMMARVTRPIEEALKDIPGSVNIRSTTGRGSADISVFFRWNVDMAEAELQVNSRLSQIRGQLPSTVETSIHRLTFSAFPIAGLSLTSDRRPITELSEMARSTVKPRLLRIPGVARVDLLGGRTPEYHVIVDPAKANAVGLSLPAVSDALAKSNLVASAGMHEEKDTLFLTVVDGRVHGIAEIEDLAIATAQNRLVRVREIGRVERGPEPVYNVVTADGVDAVLINVRSQPDGSTLAIARAIEDEMRVLKGEMPLDVHLEFFYDQSILVRDSVRSVWEAIFFGLALSVFILFLFLKSARMTAVAVVVIPVTVLMTLVAMAIAGMSFNLMTLGGIAAAIGLVIDDAIVVVEAIHVKISIGLPRLDAVREAASDIFVPLIGSTMAPVLVFVPLAFLDGVWGVFFRALAMTMVVSLMTSLVVALTLTPSLASWILEPTGSAGGRTQEEVERGGVVLRRVSALYERALRLALGHAWICFGICLLVLVAGVLLFFRLKTDYLPPMDEGGFVIDYIAPAGTSLTETNRELLQVEETIRGHPDVESYSRRTGAQMGLFAVTEANTGDYMVKLKRDRKKSTADVIRDLRHQLTLNHPRIEWEFASPLTDLIGDLTSTPEPVEIKVYSNDLAFLRRKAPDIQDKVEHANVVDSKSGIVVAGPTLSVRVRPRDAQRFGMDADDVAQAVNTAFFGQTASSILEGEIAVNVRVKVEPSRVDRKAAMEELPLRSPRDGSVVRLRQVADLVEEPGELELSRENLRQMVAVTGRLEGVDLGTAMNKVKGELASDNEITPGMIELGGLYQQQQEAFRQLCVVLLVAILLVYLALLLEFRSFMQSSAILFGAVLALFGAIAALWITDMSLNIISFLGAIIGVGIVHKNGLLMLDFVAHLRAQGLTLTEALVRSGLRRLRPVLMTSMAAALGMLPMAYGVGSGADMLRPLAIAVMGSLCISVLLSLIATPVTYYVQAQLFGLRDSRDGSGSAS
jgi:CzcA family heavy metal efflux pump